MDFEKLVIEAKKYAGDRTISPFIECGHAASAILTDKGNVYVGISILTRVSQGLCAERNAISNMITHGESKITKLVCVDRSGEVRIPCGACREYLMQLDKSSPDIKILTKQQPEQYVELKELLPDWWGEGRF